MALRPPFSPKLSLPQHETESRKRQAELHAAQDAYAYTYDRANLRGVAMCADMPKSENPEKGWIGGVVSVSTKILQNAQKMAQDDGDVLTDEFRDMVGCIAKEGVATAMAELGELATKGKDTGLPNRFGEYAEMFRAWELPTVGTEHHLDSTFARMRLAGPNPAWIRRVDPKVGLPDDFGVRPEHFRAAMGEGERLEDALAQGRLFCCEYRQLLGRKPGCTPVPAKIDIDYASDPAGWDAAYKQRQAAYEQGAHPKHLVAPLVLFAVPKKGGSLTPVAIQLFPNGYQGQRYPVFTPRDGLSWYAAKMCVNAADGNVHEAISHLGTTHLVQEAFALAMHNCFAPRHPLHRLLSPHFEGTFAINRAADSSLVSPGGGVDTLLMPTIADVIDISAEALRGYDFANEIFPQQLKRRGVDCQDTLVDYPYRDDGLLVWQALEEWVRSFVHHHYVSDRDVVEDVELQAFVAQVGAYRVRDALGREVGGGIKGVDESDGKIQHRSYLVSMVTQIIWNGSAQHAAVNFPQAHEMAYAPNMPLALMGSIPSSTRYSESEIRSLLPVREVAHNQVVIGKLLGGLYHTQLGHYPRVGPPGLPWFGPGPVNDFEQALHTRLADVEATIDARNLERPAYRYLRPSEIPQSINI